MKDIFTAPSSSEGSWDRFKMAVKFLNFCKLLIPHIGFWSSLCLKVVDSTHWVLKVTVPVSCWFYTSGFEVHSFFSIRECHNRWILLLPRTKRRCARAEWRREHLPLHQIFFCQSLNLQKQHIYQLFEIPVWLKALAARVKCVVIRHTRLLLEYVIWRPRKVAAVSVR